MQTAMQSFIDINAIDGKMYVYDAQKGEMLRLHFDVLHKEIVKKGDFYLSCADFTDQHNRKIDVDFLVRAKGDVMITTQPVVHSVAGNKRACHLEE